MRGRVWTAALVALVLALIAQPAAAQEPLAQWTDATGRVSIDLSDSDWRGYARPDADQPDLMVMFLPARGGASGTPPQLCSIEQTRRPLDRPADQATANEMVRLTAQLDDTRAWVDDQSAPPTKVIESDGVISAYTSEVITDPRSQEQVTRLRRTFILANEDSLEWFKIVCLAFPAAGPDAPAALQAIMERVRVRLEGG